MSRLKSCILRSDMRRCLRETRRSASRCLGTVKIHLSARSHYVSNYAWLRHTRIKTENDQFTRDHRTRRNRRRRLERATMLILLVITVRRVCARAGTIRSREKCVFHYCRNTLLGRSLPAKGRRGRARPWHAGYSECVRHASWRKGSLHRPRLLLLLLTI